MRKKSKKIIKEEKISFMCKFYTFLYIYGSYILVGLVIIGAGIYIGFYKDDVLCPTCLCTDYCQDIEMMTAYYECSYTKDGMYNIKCVEHNEYCAPLSEDSDITRCVKYQDFKSVNLSRVEIKSLIR